MNYLLHYTKLVDRGKQVRDIFTERHHIVPKCMGGTNDASNISNLTPEEHFLAHQLLVKIHPGNPKIIFGALQMTRNGNGYRVNNKLFGWLRRELSKNISKINRANAKTRTKKAGLTQRGKKLSDDHREKIGKARLGAKHSEETKLKQSIAAKSRTPEQRAKRYAAATSPEALEKYRKASANKVWMINQTTKKTSFVNKELVNSKLTEGWLLGRSLR